jgi:hemoglobin/transferrin/lactoferrin receptor protein
MLLYKFYLYTIIILFTAQCLSAQTPDSVSVEGMIEEVVISANKFSENKKEVPQQIHLITARRIELQNTQTVPDLLAQSGMVAVQKSQAGGGSPIMRGFEASRVLLVVDGVRMNNLIYRTGHLQNAMTVDQNVLERVEMLFGPASTTYGSDALGGVVHFRTKDPLFSTRLAQVFTRYSTANQEKTGHLHFNLGGKRLASLSSFTYSDFGDVRMGTRPQALDTLWGLRRFVQTRINGRDTAIRNDNLYMQRNSGYRQYDALQKVAFQLNDRTQMLLNLQYSTTTDLPRYDRLTDPNPRTRLNQAEWYYGPQERLMAAYELQSNNVLFFNQIRLNVNFQDIEESRYTRGWNNPNRIGRVEAVQVYGVNFDATRKWVKHDLYTGIEAQYSSVNSTATALNINTGVIDAASTRYPDGGNFQRTAAAYLSHSWRLHPKLILTDGVRLQAIYLRSEFESQRFYRFPYTEAAQNNTGWSGNLSLMYTPSPILRMTVLGSSGFRAPNVDDMAKVFDTNSRNRLVVVPNPDLKPEQTYNLDFNVTLSDRKQMVTWENILFTTRFARAISQENFLFNGESSILYDNVLSQVRANVNAQEANLWGLSSVLRVRPVRGFSGMASYNYTYGRIRRSDGVEEPLDHVAPAFGTVSVQYQTARWQAETWLQYSAWKRIKDFRLGTEDNEQYALPAGMPGWWTLNVRGSWQALKNLRLQAGVDNILDVQYRVFASGIHQPGRNIFVTLRGDF